MYTVHSQRIPPGSCCISVLSRGPLNIPTHPCHTFIQHGIKIVCLNCYLGSVNTSGQQELKLNSTLAAFLRATPPSAPHNSNLTVNSGQVRQSLVAAPSVYCWTLYPDDWHTCGMEISKETSKGERSGNKKMMLVHPTPCWPASTRFHSCSDCPPPFLLSRHSLEQWWIPVYHRLLWCTLSLVCCSAVSLFTHVSFL